ncbi:MAG: trypsin-like serine protease [Bryobacteraceae bacterium]|nr:trypsin-like serine protease [Bryobacteraceae bacterium]
MSPLRATTVAGDPMDPRYQAPPGAGFDGVVNIVIANGGFLIGCSGALLSSGRHILTAGHCVTSSYGGGLPQESLITFVTPSGVHQREGVHYAVYPGWDGDLFSGTDLAIITLDRPAPLDATRYDIYRNNDELGQVATLSGFGMSGSGWEGVTSPSGVRRQGENRYELTAEYFGMSPNILMFDFDSGLADNDAFGWLGVAADLGQGLFEVHVAPGDSGGPSFLNGLIAGIHTLGATFALCPPDVSTPSNAYGGPGCKMDFSFGELGGDIRVSAFAAFIDGAMQSVPEPGTFALSIGGLSALIALARRRKRARYARTNHDAS